MKSILAFIAKFFAASLSALCVAGAAPPGVHLKTPELPVVLVNPGAEFQDDARPGAMIIGMDRTPKGRLWGCWTGTGDKKDGYFLLATSDDGGASWSKPRLAVGARTESAQEISGALVGNLWTDPKGRLWLFFDQQLGDPQKRITNWFIRCDDPDAAEPAWSEPVTFSEGCTLNKPTVLKNGDWLLPVSDWHQKTARVFASTDEGASWKERGSLQFPEWEFDEHMMVELKDGRLWMLARTKGQPHESFSTDGGKTWSTPKQAASVQNVNARFFLRRLTSGRILLVKNGSPAERLQKRTHMSAWLSDDEGQTWKGGLLLDERNAVSYPDGFEAPDGLIHILYDWNRHTDAEILLAKFREEDVLAGKIVSKDAKLLMLANKATGAKPEKLYNGIELPHVWPPRLRDPNSAEPMPVPYLRNPPKTILIDIGRQFFVDDFLIESTDLKRVFHQAEKFEGNPVFKAETADEKERNEVVYLGQGGVFYDPSEKLFKMFYTAGWRGPLAMATSPDLKTWTRPELGLHGGNTLLPEGAAWGTGEGATAGTDNALWYDINATDPKERIKYLTCWMHAPKEQRVPGLTHSLQVSDGVTWSKPVPCNAPASDYGSIFYNPFRNKWVQSIKQDGPRGRCRYYVESERFLDGADWSKSVYWTNADRLDRPEPAGAYPGKEGEGDPPQLYNLAAVAYESLMIGMHQIHRGPDNRLCKEGGFPKLTDLELGFSRDGFHWDRPDRRGFIRGERQAGAWDRAYLHTTTGVFVVLDDRLVFPYCAYSGDAGKGRSDMYGGGAIGLASLRRDGFASMEGTGLLTTRAVKFKGRHLFVNMNGELRVEVLDETGKVIRSSKVATGDQTKLKIEWADGSELSDVAGRNVKFRFHLTKGSLYAFWVTPDENGASGGYVGAGGPGFAGWRDTTDEVPLAREKKMERTDSLLPPEVHTAPLPARYQDESRMFLCGLGIAVSPGGRLWVTFKNGEIPEDEDNCTFVVTSGDRGEIWSKPVLAVDIDGLLRTNDPGIWTDPNGKVTLIFGQVCGIEHMGPKGRRGRCPLLLDEQATSYPDAAQDKGGVLHIVHDFGRYRERIVCYHRITEADIKAGRLVTQGSRLGGIANQATHPTIDAAAYEAWSVKINSVSPK